jgi:hypothetical protein
MKLAKNSFKKCGSQKTHSQQPAPKIPPFKVQPRDFFQTLITILTQIRDTFPQTNEDIRFQRTVSVQTPSAWSVAPSNEEPSDRTKSIENPSNLTGGAVSEANESRVAFQERVSIFVIWYFCGDQQMASI